MMVRPSQEIKTVAVIGGGVIGGGWAARLLLHGIDVRIYDPRPQTERRVREILANAERAWSRLTLATIPIFVRWRAATRSRTRSMPR